MDSPENKERAGRPSLVDPEVLIEAVEKDRRQPLREIAKNVVCQGEYDMRQCRSKRRSFPDHDSAGTLEVGSAQDSLPSVDVDRESTVDGHARKARLETRRRKRNREANNLGEG
ncbi:hypothetical protein OSTOST_03797, partial [Ostertagia ostertagi]